MMTWKVCGRETFLSFLKSLLSNLARGDEEHRVNFTQKSRSLDRDSKVGP
jgi:hypothetical protein